MALPGGRITVNIFLLECVYGHRLGRALLQTRVACVIISCKHIYVMATYGAMLKAAKTCSC